MMVSPTHRRDVSLVALLGFMICGLRPALAQWPPMPPPPVVYPNERVNHEPGPNDDPNFLLDDDWANDPPHAKPQREPTVAVIRGLQEPQIFAGWIDGSWMDDNPPPYSNDVSIGFGVSLDIHGTWSVLHDLARSQDGYGALGYLPPPATGGPAQWLEAQGNPVAAVVTADSGATGVHLVGAEEGTVDGNTANRIFYAWSADGQSNWDVRTVSYTPDISTAGYRDELPYVSVWGSHEERGAEYVFVTWTRHQTGLPFSPREIVYSVSSDGGQSFSQPLRLSDPDVLQEVADTVQASSAFGPDGKVHVVWGQAPYLERAEYYDYVIKYRSGYLDPNEEWDPPTNQAGYPVAVFNPLSEGFTSTPPPLTNFNVIDRPSIVVDHTCGRNGWVYVCYASEVKLEGWPWYHPDIFVRRNRGQPPDPNDPNVAWDPPVRVNDDDPMFDPYGVPVQTVQVMPWIAQDDLGHIGVGFYDRRDDTAHDDDPNDWNKLQRYYFAYSSDGVTSFWDNVGVSDPNNPSDTYPVYWPDPADRVMIGLYTQLGAAHSSFFAAWCDTRNWGRLIVERIGDIYFSEIEALDGVPPDGDGDCDVDLDDFMLFTACYRGAARPVPRQCWGWDYDADGDVDIDDYSLLFLPCYTGAQLGCDWQQGGGGEAATGGGETFDAAILADPEIQSLYWMLYEYCLDNGIAFP